MPDLKPQSPPILGTQSVRRPRRLRSSGHNARPQRAPFVRDQDLSTVCRSRVTVVGKRCAFRCGSTGFGRKVRRRDQAGYFNPFTMYSSSSVRCAL
jgi:hypothetical protein